MRYRFCMMCGGGLRRVRQEGRVRQRCRRCSWIFYGNPIPAAVALVMRRGKILLGRRADKPYRGTWDLPGGFVEAEETPEQGLAREIREEIGARIGSARFLGFFNERYGPAGFPILAVVYRITLKSGRLRHGSDVSELRWFSPRQLPYRQIGFPSMRRALRLYARGASRQKSHSSSSP